MPEQSYPYERPTPGELADQLAKCAKGIEGWKKTSGRVDYPGTLTVQTGHSTTYNAAIDISDTPQPPGVGDRRANRRTHRALDHRQVRRRRAPGPHRG